MRRPALAVLARAAVPRGRVLALLTVAASLGLGAATVSIARPSRLVQAPFELVGAICLARFPLDPPTQAQQTRARRRLWAQQRSAGAAPLPASRPAGDAP